MKEIMEPNTVPSISHLPDEAYLEIDTCLALFKVSKSSWYEGIAAGDYPKQVKLRGKRTSRWIVGEIRAALVAQQKHR